ncbi:hypothetical protein FI667_g16332, partial [Globisporangium splendens]
MAPRVGTGVSTSSRRAATAIETAATTARKKKKATSGTGSTKVGTTTRMPSGNNMELLRNANLGKYETLASMEIPFLLGTSSSPSFSILGNVQDAIRQCDTTYVTPNTLPIEIPTSRPKAKPQKKPRTSKSTTPGRTARTRSASILGTNDSQTATLLSERVRGNQVSGPDEMPPLAGTSKKRAKPGAIQVPPPPPVSAYINPMQTQIMDDLAAALECAQREFATLNARYKDTVAQLESSRSGTNGDGKGNHSAAQLSSALGPLLDDLEAKGKQVNLLKQVLQQASNSSINPLRRIVHSPEAIRRKTASLRLLNEYRQLEREAKSPRASTGAPSYDHHQRSTSFFH